MKKKYYFLLLVLLPYTFMAQVVTTFAGSGTRGALDATGTAASFNRPYGVAFSASGTMFVADGSNNKIRKITAAGEVSTLAGSGTVGAIDATGAAAGFYGPCSVAVDANGNVYAADYNNHKIRKITASGVVSTLAGSGLIGDVDATGAAASFNYPTGVAVDGSGNVFVVDSDNHKIRKINATGVVTSFAGSVIRGDDDATGVAASFNYPTGIAINASGNLFIADSGNNKIRKITASGVVSTLAGSGAVGTIDATGAAASFSYPTGVAVDASGNVFVADYNNYKIRKITAAGVVSTLAGSGSAGAVDATGAAASFNETFGLAVDASGTVYVADSFNHKIRKISAPLATSDFDFSSKVSVSPNPSKAIFNIDCDSNATIGVYDLLGKQLLTKKIELGTTALDMTAYQAGIYLLKVTNESNQSKTIKIVKE